MKLDVEISLGDVHIHLHGANESRIEQIWALLNTVSQKENVIMSDLSTLETDVKANSDTVQSAVILLNGLKAALDAAGTDPVKLKALSDQLESNTAGLAAAVVANTI